MANTNIYVWMNGKYDLSRWISVGHRVNGTCILHLSDLCNPGQLSRLTTVAFPLNYLKSASDRGAFQINLGTGYLLLQRSGDLIQISFRSLDDSAIVKADFLAKDFVTRIEAMERESLNLAVPA